MIPISNTQRPNIVLVSIDSLRADHCGFLGADHGLTPAMDGLAEEGVNFRTAVAPGPQTFSSMPAVFTGHHRPPGDIADDTDERYWKRRLEAIDAHLRRHTPFPERLQELGYTTAGFSPNPWTSRASGFDRGFDEFVDLSRGVTVLGGLVDRIPGIDADRRSVELVLNLLSGSAFFAQWESFYDQLTAVREQLPEPYFLWVFLLDTHYPFITSRAHREEQSLPGMYYSNYRAEGAMRGSVDTLSDAACASIRRSYRETIRAADDFVETLQSDLRADDPTLVLHSDHGEAFGEHDTYGHHLDEVYEENVHVPYLVHNADVTADVEEPASLATIPETLLSIAREGTFDPADATGRYAVASSEDAANTAVRGRRFKYLRRGEEETLFDLDHDPGERTDCSAEYPAQRRQFRRHLEQFDRHLGETGRMGQAATVLAERSDLW